MIIKFNVIKYLKYILLIFHLTLPKFQTTYNKIILRCVLIS